MITPNTPHQTTPVLNPDGTMHDSWHRFFSQMTAALQDTTSEEGFVPGAQPIENINLLDNEQNMGRLIYDNTNQAMKINNAGKYKEIYTRPEELTSSDISKIPSKNISGTMVYNKTTNKLLYGISGVFREIGFT